MKREQKRAANRAANSVDAALVGTAKGSLDTTPATKFQCPECSATNTFMQGKRKHTCSACGTSHKTLVLISGNYVL